MKKLFRQINIRFISAIALAILLVLIAFTGYYIRKSDGASLAVENALALIFRLEKLETNINKQDEILKKYISSGGEDDYHKLGNWYAAYINATLKSPPLSLSLPLLERDEAVIKDLASVKQNEDDIIKNLRKVFGRDSVLHNRYYERRDAISILLLSHLQRLQVKTENVLQKENKKHLESNNLAFLFLVFLVIFFIFLMVINYFIFKNDNDKRKRAEKKLIFNASLIRNISDPIITTDKENLITNWNKYAEKLYGFQENEVVGKAIGELLNIKVGEAEMPAIMESYRRNEYWHGEAIHHTKDGIPLHVEVNSSMIKDDDGQMVGTVAVIRNISDRKITEARLVRLTTELEDEVKEKTAELSDVFERITDAFIALDNDWRYTYVNSKAAEMHHMQPKELLGKVIWDLFPDVVNEPFYQALHTAKETQEALKITLPYSSSGKWFEDLIYPSSNGISVYYHDITEKKLAEIEVGKAHDKLFSHINNTPLAVVEFDTDFKIVQWSNNAINVFGWNTDEVLNQEFSTYDIVHPDDRRAVEKEQSHLGKESSTSSILVNRNIRKDGKIIYCEWYNSVLKDEHGNNSGILSLVQDITKRKKIEYELQEAEEKFRNLVEESLVGVFIFQHNRFVYVNPAFNRMFGYEVQQSLDYISRLNLSFVEDGVPLSNQVERIIQPGKSLNYYELVGTHLDSNDVYLEIYGTPTQVNGEPAIIGSLVNITQRKHAEKQMEIITRELIKSNERFYLVARATNDAIWDWDMEKNVVWGNDTFLQVFGLLKDSPIVLEDFLAQVHPDDQEPLKSTLINALKSKLTFVQVSFRMILNEGDEHIMSNSAYIVYNNDGRGYRMLGALQNITAQKNYENQILAEKKLSDDVINSLPGIFYIFSREGKLYRWNKNLEMVSGFSTDEIKEINPMHFFSEAEAAKLFPKIENVFRDGEGNVEADFLGKNSIAVPYYLTGKIIQYEGEDCLMGVGIDITDKKLAQEKIKQSEEKFRMLIEQASDGILISDHSGKFTEVNKSAGKITGFKRSELMKMHIRDLLGRQHMDKVLIAQDELLGGKTILTEAEITNKNGEIVNIEVSAKLLGDGRFQGIIRDVSSRIKAAEALKQSENKYRLLFNQNPMPMWMISLPERKFLDVNPAAVELYGYSREEFLTMTITDIRPKEAKTLFNNQINKFKSGIQHAGVWQHTKKNGKVMNVNIISHDIVYEGLHAKLILANDVTEKLVAEEKLKKSNEDFRQLASHMETVREAERTNIAREIHDELGQQLTGLKMDISWLKRRINSTDPIIQQKIDETLGLIDNTVNSVRKIATELRPSILDDLGLVAAMDWQSEEFQKRSEIKVDFTYNDSNIEIAAPVATQVFRMYQESLTNVLRHSGASKVKSTLNVRNNVLILNISDNGKGFNAEEIEHKKTLGLLGMRERASILGGSFEVSGKPGKGTHVIIVVPLSL
ncbi:MAG: PAS domain S-box protein [Ferruginibacter sp.]